MPENGLPLTQVFQPILGNLAKMLALCRSNETVTERLESDLAKALKRSEEERSFLEALFATIPEMIWVKNLDVLCSAADPRAAADCHPPARPAARKT